MKAISEGFGAKMKKQLVFLCTLAFAAALSAGDLIAARRDFRKEAADCHYDYQYLVRKMQDPDVEIARFSITLLAKHHPGKALSAFGKISFPADPLIAEAVLIAIADFPESETAGLRHKILSSSSDPRLRPFKKARLPHRMNFSLRNDPSYDHAVTVIKKILLPKKNWNFTADPNDEGFQNRYYAEDFDDSGWRKISVTGCWEKQNVGPYDGIAWYRVKFRMPEKIHCSGVDISFGAVDESAWVWLNGKYIGQHDIGPAGWNVPFSLNIASELKWGEENILAVRVKDTAGAGGIWKPAEIEVLQ